MTKRNFGLAIGLTMAFLAMQTPHLAQANGGGGGEREVINNTVFPARHGAPRSLRNAVPAQNQAIKAEPDKKFEAKGIFGRFFKTN